jgi:FkbM family methyltransferase
LFGELAMKRSTIRGLGRFMPRSLREYAKRQFTGHSIDPVDRSFTLDEEGPNLICRIDEQICFAAPVSCRNDLAHYTTSLEGRAEFAALVDVATSPGGVLFDIGAHCGLISSLWCAARAANHAFGFEPSPALVRRITEIRDLNQFGDRMQINQLGIGEAKSTASMLIDPVGGFVQSQHFDHTMWSKPESIEISIESIQGAAERLGVIPNVIKLDIEGFEYEAIKGSVGFLAEHRPVLFLELHLNYLEQRKLSPQNVVELLQQCGYAFFTYSGTELKAEDVYGTPLAICHVVAK